MSSVVGLELPNAWRTAKPNNNVDFDISANQLNLTANRQMFIPGSTVTWPSGTLHKGLADPVDAQDAATKAFVEAQVSGKDELSELDDVTITSRAANEVLVVNPGNTFWVNAKLIDANLASGVFANIIGIGVQTQPLDMGTNKISNVVDPTLAQDVATKAFVDAQVTGKDELSELNDVTITARAANQVLVVNAGNTFFVNDFLVNANLASGVFAAITGIGVQSQNLDLATFGIVTATGALGFLLKHDGARYDDFAIGTSLQVLRVNAGGTDLEFVDPQDTPPFPDTISIVKGSADPTKQIRFEVDGLTTATIRVITPPDKDITLVGTVDKLDVFAATSSAELATVISDETGTGLLVFGTSPIIITPTIASFINANHDHTAGAGGGQLTNSALISGVFAAITGIGIQTQNLDLDTFGIETATGALGALLKHDGTRYDDFLIGADNTILAVAGLDLNYQKIVNDLLASGVFAAITGLGAQSQALNMNTNLISNVTDPVSAQDAATKSFVESIAINGVKWKEPARVATTANITLSGEQTIDGILTSADRVLVKDQTLGENNGIYLSAAGAWTRTTDADTAAEIETMAIFIQEGTVNADQGFVLTTDPPIVLGTTVLVYGQFTGLGQITAGAGLTKTGNILDVIGTTNRIDVFADNVDISVSYVGQSSIITLGTITTGVWNASIIAEAFLDTNVARNTDNLSFFATTTSAELAGVISDETGSGLLVFNDTPTLLTPTIADFTNATHSHVNAAGGGVLGKLALPSSTVFNDQINTYGAFAQIFPDDQLQILNPLATFKYHIRSSAIITADKDILLPLLTANDIFAVLGLAQTFTLLQTFSGGINMSSSKIASIGGATINDLAPIPTVNGGNDELWIRDATDGVIKKVTRDSLISVAPSLLLHNMNTDTRSAGTIVNAFAGADPSSSGAEVNAENSFPVAVKLKNMTIRISGMTDADSILSIRKNGVNGNQTITIPANTTGTFRDVTNTDNYGLADVGNYRMVVVGTGSIIMDSMAIEVVSQ